MADLVEVHGDTYRQDLYNLGVATSLAMSNPKKLPDLLNTAAQKITNDQVHPMLRVHKPKTKENK